MRSYVRECVCGVTSIKKEYTKTKTIESIIQEGVWTTNNLITHTVIPSLHHSQPHGGSDCIRELEDPLPVEPQQYWCTSVSYASLVLSPSLVLVVGLARYFGPIDETTDLQDLTYTHSYLFISYPFLYFCMTANVIHSPTYHPC